MNVVSLVPSWTETLLECGADVVGRTRFCVHPEARVRSIAVAGGTKDLNLDALRKLSPDLVVLDREENTKEMAKALEGYNVHVTHVRRIEDCSREAKLFADEFARNGESEVAAQFIELSSRWQRVSNAPSVMRTPGEWPGVLEWIGEMPAEAHSVCYLIWRNPWMAVGEDTFIASVLEKVGVSPTRTLEPNGSTSRYPEIASLDDLPQGTVLLFSSEPFPFSKKKSEIAALELPKAIVDGEVFSWFGVRSLAFIERSLGIQLE